jgi:hypothetical protein
MIDNSKTACRDRSNADPYLTPTGRNEGNFSTSTQTTRTRSAHIGSTEREPS